VPNLSIKLPIISVEQPTTIITLIILEN